MFPNQSCSNITVVNVTTKTAITSFMFVAGVVGNLLALIILGVHQKERHTKSSAFCILVTGLAVTDLLGTCLLSPPVFVCYAKELSLIGLINDHWLCHLFAFAMTFFGLAPMLILCAMAVERCLAISHPYLYSKYVRLSFTRLALVFIYLFTAAFCLLPFMGYGGHRQYCPGTWCFIDMEGEGNRLVLAFSLSYSTLMALLIVVVFVCNGSVIVSLCRMHRSQRTRRGSVLSTGRKRKMSLAWFGQGEEEVDHLMLLALMTLIFVVCSLPLTVSSPAAAVLLSHSISNLLCHK
ncbi:Prostacyclin receptor [Merluccius polli]|uniref:Prostacyclin receptor n=1 Tax=Merluccius polli TaxID=89951 RepID=A0AA47P390_MERPO|nr:Prostacyclin receptor [Merluccius polli]